MINFINEEGIVNNYIPFPVYIRMQIHDYKKKTSF